MVRGTRAMRGRHVSRHLAILTASLLAATPCLGQTVTPDGDEPLLPGQSRRGISLQVDGTLFFQGEEIGQIRDPGAAQAFLSAPSPKRGLIYVNHADSDWGGIQGSIVDPIRGKVIVKEMLPYERIWGKGVAEHVVQVCKPVSWSPEEDYALTAECGEVVRNVVVADLAGGTSQVIEVGNFEKDQCDWQQFAMENSAWVSPTVYKLKVILQQNPWADQPCAEDRRYAEYDLLVDARSFEVKPAEGVTLPPQTAGLDHTTREVSEAKSLPLQPGVLVRTTSRLNLRKCPASEKCEVVRTLAAGTDLEVLSQQEEWLQVRDVVAGDSGWVHSSYTTAIVTPNPEVPSPLRRMTPLHLVIALLLLAFPLLAGVSVWSMKPASTLARMDNWCNWILNRKKQASSSNGFFGRYWGRPVLYLSGLLVRWTEKIGDPYLRSGARIALFLYFGAFILVATLLLAYLAVVVVVGIVAIIVTIWILSKVFSSGEDDSPLRSTRSSERASGRDDEEERRREMLLNAGTRGRKVYKKTGMFAEAEHGRVDNEGRIYQKTGMFSEEQVGRIDQDGRVFTKTGLFSEEEVGRIREDGGVYEKSGVFSEDKIGRIDEAGRIHRKAGLFSEEQVGRMDSND